MLSVAALPLLGLVDMTWQLSLNIGRLGASSALPDGWSEETAADGRTFFHHSVTLESRWDRPSAPTAEERASLLGHPLAMFSPGGGRATAPSWFDEHWARAGATLDLPLELEFLSEDYGPTGDEPLRRTTARKLHTRCSSPEKLVKTVGVAWGMVELSKVEALLVWSIDLPNGCTQSPDVTLPEGTRLFCSTQVWRGEQLRHLEGRLQSLRSELALHASDALAARVKEYERGLPPPGAPTLELEGPWPGTVTVSSCAAQRRGSSTRAAARLRSS